MKSMNGQRWRSLMVIPDSACRLIAICIVVLLSMIFLLASPVRAQPTILPGSLPQGQVGVPYTATLVAAPVTPPCTWTITSGSLPPGLTLDVATGTISGTPTTAGTYTFFATVTDSIGTSPQQGFFITVTSPPITFLTTSLPHATEGSTYSEVVNVTGGASPYTWTIASGTLPSGLTLAATSGIISGKPDKDTAGTHNFTVKVTDSSAPPLSGQQSFSLIVQKGSFESIVSIAPSLLAGETRVFVEGEWVATLEGGESTLLSFDPGTSQTITVDPTISHSTKTNVRFAAEVYRIVVSELSPDAYFDYHTEYFIDFKTDPSEVGQVTGTGWYREGYTLTTGAPSEIEDTPDTQFRFSHWLLPTGETVWDEEVGLTVTMPGTIVANYDTYYKLTLAFLYGETGGGTWHKAGSEAQWTIEPREVDMSGILGLFGGKLIAANYSGTEVMDSPKTIAVDWESDYTRPILFISLIVVAIGLGAFFAYRYRKGPQPTPTPALQPSPPPQTTVVMIGDTSRQQTQTTREQLLRRFSELLDKYEEEIKASVKTKEAGELGEAESTEGKRLLPAPVTLGEQEIRCSFTARKLLRVVAGTWRQVETRTISSPPSGEGPQATQDSHVVVWTRDIYNEWEILTCLLPTGHTGNHQGSFRIVYTLLNTITEEKAYGPGEEVTPPRPHFTDGMPEVEITTDQIISLEQLPTNDLP